MYAVIMAGGSGSRLWPASRGRFPKQFLTIAGEQTMLQETLARLDGVEVSGSTVICNEEHRFIVAQQAQDAALERLRQGGAVACNDIGGLCHRMSKAWIWEGQIRINP
mgnify:CR=1 FL=1